MTPDYKPGSHEEMEARITALLLGELPEAEAAEVRAAVKRDPELSRLCQRLKGTIELVRQASAPAEPTATPATPMQLSDARRQRVLQRFKTVTPPQFATSRREKSWSILIPLAALVMFLLAVALFLPAMGRAKSRGLARSDRGETDFAFLPPSAGRESGSLAVNLASPPAQSRELAVESKNGTFNFQNGARQDLNESLAKSVRAAKPEPSAAGVVLKVEDSLQKDRLSRRLDEVASSVENLAEKEVLRQKVDENRVELQLRRPASDTRSAPVASFGVAAASPPAPATLPSATPQYRIGGLSGGGGFGGGGGGGGAGSPAQNTWYFSAKPADAEDKLGEVAQNVDRGGVESTERFARRYGLAPAAKSAAVLSPAPAGASASGLAATTDNSKLGFVLGEVSPVQGFGEKSAVREGLVVQDSAVRGFYDDNGRAEGVVAAGVVNGTMAGVGGPVVTENSPVDSITPSANRGEVTAKKVPILGDVPLIGRMFSRDKDGVEALGRSAGETAKLHDLYYADSFGMADGRAALTTNAAVVNGDSVDALGLKFSKKPAQQTWDEKRDSEVLGKELAKTKGAKVVAETLDMQVVDAATGLPAGTVYPLDPANGLPAKPTSGVDPTTGLPISYARSVTAIDPATGLPLAHEGPAAATSSVTGLPALAAEPELKAAIKTPPPVPQPEVATAVNPFSTFSLNIADVSFRLAEASLNQGQMPNPGSIRSEEFINAFEYRDPEPAPGMPVGFTFDRTRSPFAQNRDLLRFSIKTAAAGRQMGCPLNLVVLLDNSGSMERADRVNIRREAIRVLADQLRPEDKISLITFARTARLWDAGVPGNQAASIRERVSQLTPEGGTNLEEAMNLAYQTALQQYLPGGINRVVILTDGAANLGNVNPEQLKAKVESHRKQGIALDCFGIGWEGYNDDLLETLARNGDGRYGFLNTPEETESEFAAKLAGALHVAASDVKVQVEFNPARVTSYRQVGYAKHQLTKEQFRDNTVDAAEIGAAESGNALYVVETNPQGAGPVATVRVRFKVPGTADYKEHEWMVPYTGNAISLEQANPAMRLTSTAAAFSEWLAGNPYAGEVSPDQLLNLLRGVKEVYSPDGRPQKLEWMIRQAKSISGK